ncbi:hypothetical protein Fmac_006505 [Flemingia macrophylla]|uniref:Uncharacterized protein n=1 Tax=Flemingia macrophylla TaxID=520843 RepID=A0ABD1NAU8_9FABA
MGSEKNRKFSAATARAHTRNNSSLTRPSGTFGTILLAVLLIRFVSWGPKNQTKRWKDFRMQRTRAVSQKMMLLRSMVGYGEISDHDPNQTVKSMALDIEELGDRLRLGSKFYVIGLGFSLGDQVV